jgi:hypothetical protein
MCWEAAQGRSKPKHTAGEHGINICFFCFGRPCTNRYSQCNHHFIADNLTSISGLRQAICYQWNQALLDLQWISRSAHNLVWCLLPGKQKESVWFSVCVCVPTYFWVRRTSLHPSSFRFRLLLLLFDCLIYWTLHTYQYRFHSRQGHITLRQMLAPQNPSQCLWCLKCSTL